MHNPQRVVGMVIVVALALAACGGDDDDAEPTEASEATEVVEPDESAEFGEPDEPSEQTTGTNPPDTADSTDDCLAQPTATATTRGGVGTLDTQENDRVEVDCVEVFGGEELREQAVIASDGGGVAGFRIGNSSVCKLRPNTTVEVVPESDVLLAVASGEILCTFFGDGTSRSFQAGDDLTITTTEAHVMIVVGPNQPPSVTVFDGYVVFDPPSFACRSVVGPRQQIELAAVEQPQIIAFDPRNLTVDLQDSFKDLGGRTEPPEIPEGLLPGLTALLDDGDITLAVDGEVLGSPSVDDAVDVAVFEHIVGRQVIFDDATIGKFDIRDDLAVPEPISPVDISRIAPIDIGSNIAVAVDEIAVEEALDEPVVELTELPILTAPDGGTWTVVFDGARTDLADTLNNQLREALDSGAYSRYYEAAFEATPDYSLLRPDLMSGRDRCG